MNSLIGLGVFGTFGQPFGFQQAFNSDAEFVASLDLDEHAIAVYPGTDLYAVRREIVDGVGSICFCIYSHVKEPHADRDYTFIGSCVVLKNVYAEADYVYRLLKELHADAIGNIDNVADNTIKVQHANDLIVNEPSGLVALKANVIPISKTPFYSTHVNRHKRIFVSPDPGSSLSHADQVIAFFDDALKYYNDADAMFFSLDDDVAGYAYRKGLIKVIDWQEFANYKHHAQQQAVVRTKKGIQKSADVRHEAATEQGILPEHEATAYSVATAREDDDPYRPFDVWDEPGEGWSEAEVRFRVREYNRLFKYTNTLQAHINEMGSHKKKKKQLKQQGKAEQVKNGGKGTQKKNSGSLYHRLTSSRRRSGVLLLVIAGAICLAAGVYSSFFNKSNQSIVSNNNPALAVAVEPLGDSMRSIAPPSESVASVQPLPATSGAKPKAIAKTKIVAEEPKRVLPEEYRAEDYEPAVPKDVAGKEVGNTARQEARPSTAYDTDFLKSKDLRPVPNFEITQKDIAALSQTGIKNKTINDITKIIFDAVPTNVGNVYKGQETEYAAILFNTNRQAFQKVGNEYLCSSDFVVLHIPAYRSPRLPVVSPK